MLALDRQTGRLAYKPVYLFGHQDQHARGLFVNLEARLLSPGALSAVAGASAAAAAPPAAAGGRLWRLQLSKQHFIPTCAEGRAEACGEPRLPGLAGLLRGALLAAAGRGNGGRGDSSSSSGWQYAYAQDVRPGMLILVAAPADSGSSTNSSGDGGSLGGDGIVSALQPAVVTRVWMSSEQGLFNPFVHVRCLPEGLNFPGVLSGHQSHAPALP